MKLVKLLRLVIVGTITLMLILGFVHGVYAAGNYRVDVDGGPGSDADPSSFLVPASLDPAETGDNIDDIVWSKTDCSGNWSIWRMNDDGTNAYPLTTWLPLPGRIDEHPVFNDAKTRVVFTRNMNIWVMDRTDPPVPSPPIPPVGSVDITADELALTGPGVPIPPMGTDNHAYTHTDSTGTEWIYFTRIIPDPITGVPVRQIRRMVLTSPVPTPEGLGNPVVAVPGLADSAAPNDRWHPTVATFAGSDYLVWVEVPEYPPVGDKDNQIMVYNITTGAGPVAVVDAATDATVEATEDLFAPSITPDGTAVLYVQGDPGGLLLWIERRDFAGTPLIPGDDPGGAYVPNDTNAAGTVIGLALVLTPTSRVVGGPIPPPPAVSTTPYAVYPVSGEMDFVGDIDIYYKADLLTPPPAGAGAPSVNLTADPLVDAIVVEQSGCNPTPLHQIHEPILRQGGQIQECFSCHPPTQPPPHGPTGVNMIMLMLMGSLAMVVGSIILFLQRWRKSLISA